MDRTSEDYGTPFGLSALFDEFQSCVAKAAQNIAGACVNDPGDYEDTRRLGQVNERLFQVQYDISQDVRYDNVVLTNRGFYREINLNPVYFGVILSDLYGQGIYIRSGDLICSKKLGCDGQDA